MIEVCVSSGASALFLQRHSLTPAATSFSFSHRAPEPPNVLPMLSPTASPLPNRAHVHCVPCENTASLTAQQNRIRPNPPSHGLRHLLREGRSAPLSPSLALPCQLVGQQSRTSGKTSDWPAFSHMPIPGPAMESSELGCYDGSGLGPVPALGDQGVRPFTRRNGGRGTRQDHGSRSPSQGNSAFARTAPHTVPTS